MKVIKKYALIEITKEETHSGSDKLIPVFSFGNVSYDYGRYRNKPDYTFDTEEEAIKEAYERSEYGTYTILPIISFNTFEDESN